MPKQPTDAAILRAFQKYEEAMNVALAELRNNPEAVFPTNTPAVENAMHHLYLGQRAFNYVAQSAQQRMDERRVKREAR